MLNSATLGAHNLVKADQIELTILGEILSVTRATLDRIVSPAQPTVPAEVSGRFPVSCAIEASVRRRRDSENEVGHG